MFSFIFIGLYDTGGLHFICCTATSRPETVGKCWLQGGFGLRKGCGMGLCRRRGLQAGQLRQKVVCIGGRLPSFSSAGGDAAPLAPWSSQLLPRGTGIDAGAVPLSPAVSVIDRGCTAGTRQRFLIAHHFLWSAPFPKMPFPRLALRLDKPPPVQRCP